MSKAGTSSTRAPFKAFQQRGGYKKSKSLVKRVATLEKLVEPEFKLLDTYQDATVSSSGTFVLCNGMQRGDHAHRS